MLDKEAYADIISEVVRFKFMNLVGDGRIVYNVFLREIDILSKKISDLFNQIVEEFMEAGIRLNLPVETALYKDILGALKEIDVVDAEPLILDIKQLDKGLLPDKNSLKKLICGLNALHYHFFRWYRYLRDKYYGEINSTMVLG